MQSVFWVTTDCNLNCIYCYEGKNKKPKYMSEEIVDKSIDFLLETMRLQDDRELKITIHGGEPFLAFKEMKYLVSTVREKAQTCGIKISFGCTSNATLLNEEMLNFILEDIEDFTISMDGKKETQDQTRPFLNGKGTHFVVEKKLIQLLKMRPELRVRLTFNHSTAEYLYDNIKYLVDIGVKYIVPVRDFFDNQFSDDTFSTLKKELLKVKESLKQYCDVNIGLLDNSVIKKLGYCSGGLYSFNIDPEGFLYPCTQTVGQNEFVIGNIFDGINIKKRNQLLSYSKNENKECIGCDLYSYCSETRCKMINKIINGDYCTASPIACMEKNILYDINVRGK